MRNFLKSHKGRVQSLISRQKCTHYFFQNELESPKIRYYFRKLSCLDYPALTKSFTWKLTVDVWASECCIRNIIQYLFEVFQKRSVIFLKV